MRDAGFRNLALLFFLPCVVAASAASTESLPAAEEMLLRADEVRNPQFDYTVLVTVTSITTRSAPRVATYEVLMKGRESSVVKTLNPPVDRGRVLLMRGNDLWAFLPTVSKPLRISMRERLIGEVANGDVARVNFSGDYTPTLLREAQLEGRHFAVLELNAKTPAVTYGRVVLWIEVPAFHPYRAEFYAISGRLLKTCSYEQYRELGGRLRPTQLTLSDPLVNGQYSMLAYEHMTIAPLPDKYFTKDYMKKFME